MDKDKATHNKKVQLYFANLDYLKQSIELKEKGNNSQRDAAYTFIKVIELNQVEIDKERYTKKMAAWCTRHNISLPDGGLGKLIERETFSETMPISNSPIESWIMAQRRIAWKINYNC